MTDDEAREWISRPWTTATTRQGAEVEMSIGRAGRNEGPRILVRAYQTGSISDRELHDLLVPVWSMAEFPEAHLGKKLWINLFRTANVFPASFPRGLTVYRGAIPRRRLGMSWTASIEHARWFAGRWTGIGRPAYVYRTNLEFAAVLCDVDAVEGRGGRSEREIVVDPRFLSKVERIEKITEPTHRPSLEASGRDTVLHSNGSEVR